MYGTCKIRVPPILETSVENFAWGKCCLLTGNYFIQEYWSEGYKRKRVFKKGRTGVNREAVVLHVWVCKIFPISELQSLLVRIWIQPQIIAGFEM
jgi:hypothetical protein